MLPDAMNTSIRPLSVARFGLAGALFCVGCGKPTPPPQGGGDFPIMAVVAPVVNEALEDRVFLVGSLASPDRTDLVAEIGGTLKTLSFDEGQRVKEGDELVHIDDAKIRARLAEEEARLQLAVDEHRRMKALRDRDVATPAELDVAIANLRTTEAKLAVLQEELADASVTSPFNGVIATRHVSQGQFVNAGQALATLVRMNPLELAFDLPERYIGQMAVGRVVRFTTPAWKDEVFEGKVSALSPSLDENTRTLRVKASLPNAEHRLRPGMFGNVQLVLGVRETALLIPDIAVRYRGDQATVVVRGEDGKAAFRPITVGARFNGRLEVLAGLKAGEQVVAEGHQKLGPGTTILISPKSERYGLTPPPPPSTPPANPAETETEPNG